ncbi:Phenylalanine--tRNA ligase beta subunit [Planctomycetales bacterium 10988]|nr:Phenylalanine--tRNA ligase beta subunit [Planctomycetales bacterium 10988]
MIISWNWLKQYVALDMSRETLEDRLTMSGLNHEESEQKADDWAIDLEVTNNRPDCLGHLGVAREVAALFDQEVKLPKAEPKASGPPVEKLAAVEIKAKDLCSRYTARVIQGVKVGPSPDWLVDRLATVGLNSVNNIVDITNYVMLECGQPLHAFDLDQLADNKIIVRRPLKDEKLEAINHNVYDLTSEMCIIADGKQATGIGGVMGGIQSEVTDVTVNLLIESAEFDPVSIRQTVLDLGLPSDASYRFERGVDSQGIDWASRRCCELILEIAGGTLASGVIDVGEQPKEAEPITLRFPQIERILGIPVPAGEVERILSTLGISIRESNEEELVAVPPSFRNDLTREADLIEEVARIYGYDKIPEDVIVPMAPSSQTRIDRVLEVVRSVLTGNGFDEVLTHSAVTEKQNESFSPWSEEAPIQTLQTVIQGTNSLRRSLVPSLLLTRQKNEAVSNPRIELFEIAHVYLPQGKELPLEPIMISCCSGEDFFLMKGTIETLLDALQISKPFSVKQEKHTLLDDEKSVGLYLGETRFGVLGETSRAGGKQYKLSKTATIAEIQLDPLLVEANLQPLVTSLSIYPPSSRDFNFVVEEAVQWSALKQCIEENAGPLLETLHFQEIYRSKQLDEGKKSMLLTVQFRSSEGTLTGEQVDQASEQLVTACQKQLGATLRG